MIRGGIQASPEVLLDLLREDRSANAGQSRDSDCNALIDDFWLNIGMGNLHRATQLRMQLEAQYSASLNLLGWRFFNKSKKAIDFSDEPFRPNHETPTSVVPGRASDGLRIAYVLHNSLPVSSGGYASRADGVARGLMAQGAEVLMITRPGFPDDTVDLDHEIPVRETVDGLAYYRLLEPRRGEIPDTAYMLDAVGPVERLLRELKPDLVMAASNYLTARPAQIAARRLGLPFVYEVRGFWEITFVSRRPRFASSQKFRFMRYAETETARRSDLVFTLTKGMKAELSSRGVPGDLVHLAPNSVNPHKFQTVPRDTNMAQRWGIPEAVPVIGYIGSFVSYEGLELLADACALLHKDGVDFRLLMVGSENVSAKGLGPIASHVRGTAQKHGFENKLIMPGRVPFDDVPAYYSLMDVVTLPRYSQAVTEIVSPIKPFEAMAMAKCVLVSDVGALAEIISDGETGRIFQHGSADALKGALIPLLQSPELRQQIGARAKEWVVRNRSWEQTTTQMYKKLQITVARQNAQPQDSGLLDTP